MRVQYIIAMGYLFKGYAFAIFMLLKFKNNFAVESLEENGRYMHVHYLRSVIPWNRFKSSVLGSSEAETTVKCGLLCFQRKGCITSIFRLSKNKCYLLDTYIGPLNEYHPRTEEDTYTRMTVAFAVDPCHPNHCHKDAKCKQNEQGYQCICPPNRIGRHCDQQIPGESCIDIKRKFSNSSLKSGSYQIVSSDGLTSFIAYCDMTFETGGWTRILNVVANTNDKSRLASELKFYDELNDVKSLRNFVLKSSAVQQFRRMSNFTQIRFKCKSTAENRTIHIKSNDSAVIDYLSSGKSQNRPDACGTFERLNDDNSYLMAHCEKWTEGKWGIHYDSEQILADHSFFYPNFHHWLISSWLIRFECDTGMNAAISVGDFWEVFVK